MTEHASEVIGSAGLQLSRSELAQMIDISAVQAFHTEEDVRNLARLALEHDSSPLTRCLISCPCSGRLSGRWLNVRRRSGRFSFRRSHHHHDQGRGSTLARRGWRR